MFKTKFQKLNDKFAVGSPIPDGYKSIVELPIVFFVSLTGTGASVTVEKIIEISNTLEILPSRKFLTDNITIPWSLETQNKPIEEIKNRKIRYEMNKFFRKSYDGGIAEVIEQISIKTDEEIEYCIFDNLRHVKEITYANKIFNDAKFVLFKARMVDRIKRISNADYTFKDIGTSGFYKNILDTPRWKSVFTPAEMEEINKALDKGELELEPTNRAMQIIIKEHEEYDHHKLAMKLYDIAHDNTLLIDSSELNPVQRAEEVYNWLLSTSREQ